MLIPKVRLFCFVLSFLFSMTFFFCGIRQVGCFLFRIGGIRSEGVIQTNFLHQIRSSEVQQEDFMQNPTGANFSFHTPGYLCQSKGRIAD